MMAIDAVWKCYVNIHATCRWSANMDYIQTNFVQVCMLHSFGKACIDNLLLMLEASSDQHKPSVNAANHFSGYTTVAVFAR